MSDISKVQLPSGDIFDIVDKKSGYITGMEILSYGNSTWQDFIDAYNAKKVVYCRASSNSNPASGSQTRLAFMAYVSNADNPTNVEFQYYRSVSSHTSSQQGDQVFVYKLDKTAGWTVTTREASVKIDINSNNDGIETAYSNGVVSVSHANSVTAQTTQAVYPIAYDAQGHITSSGSAVTIPTQASDIGAIDSSEKGAASGVVPLDSSSLIDEQYLPSYVDDVIEGYYYEGSFYEDSAHTTPITGETGKIYIDLTESKSYRWSGTMFVEITSGGHTYTAGNGIDISAGDVISVDADDVQEKLVSGTNIKTINNTSLLGNGNLSIEGVPHVDLTQAQYDALTPSEKNNGTIYFITDGTPSGATNVWTGTCPTASATSAKIATTETGDFSLVEGNVAIIRFSYYSTVSPMTLNVDNTGDIALKKYGTTDLHERWWRSNGVVAFMYNGTNFVVVDGTTATTSYYGKTKLNSAIDSTSVSESATPSAVKQAYDLANSKQSPILDLAQNAGVYSDGLPDRTYMLPATLQEWQTKLSSSNTTGLIDEILHYMNNHSGVYYTGYGAYVNIISYNSTSNRYTIPSDGIVQLNVRYVDTNYVGITICNADGSNETTFQVGGTGHANQDFAVPVFKGQKVYVHSNNGEYNYVNFIPFLGVSVTGVEWSFGTRQEITLPYTAPTDGFLLESHRSTNGNNSYVQVGIGANSYVAQANSGWAESAQFVVRAGESITQQATNNATGIKYIFMPIIAQAVGSGFNACYGSLTGMGSAMTLSTASQVLQYGTFDGISCSNDSYGIKVDSGGVYQISGNTYFQENYTQNDIIHLIINKRTGSTNNYIAQTTMRVPSTAPYCIYSVGPVIVQLAAGDVVQLMAYNQLAARGTVVGYTGNGLYLHRIA